MPETAHVDDPAALKALAHPLRVSLLAALREHGPATATELARRLDTDTGSTSYHLRTLAKHGFVVDAPASGTHPRERRWAAAHRLTDWSTAALASTEAGREASALMRRRQVEVLIRDVEEFEQGLPGLESPWVEASGIGDLLVRLTPESLDALWSRFYEHLDELAAHDAESSEARPVSVVVASFPRGDA